MKLIGRDKLKRGAEEVDRWLRSWCAEVTHAHWKHADDVAEQFPNVRVRPGDNFLFPIGNSGYWLRLQIAFSQGVALILEMSEIDTLYGR